MIRPRSAWPWALLCTCLWALLLVVPGASALTSPAPRAAAAQEVRGMPQEPGTSRAVIQPVVLAGTGGITWTDVSETGTPHLWSMLRAGSSASLTVRSINTTTCPVDGWLGLSAGDRASAVANVRTSAGRHDNKPPCAAPTPVRDAQVPGWAGYLQSAEQAGFGSRLGLLAQQIDTLGASGCLAAIGPGAGVAAARPDGSVTRYTAYRPGSLTTDLAACPVTLVDVGAVRDPADVDDDEQARPVHSRAAQVRAVDARIGQVLAAAPDGSDVIVASLADAGSTERLRLAAAVGPSFGPGTLDSASTRQPGLIQSQDLTVTLLEMARVPVPTGLGGQLLTYSPAGSDDAAARERLEDLVDYDLASHEIHTLVPPFFTAFALVQILIYGLVLLVWARRLGGEENRLRGLSIVRTVAVISATVPASTFLANLLPWWRSSTPMLAILGSVGIWVALISAVALLGPWARRLLGPMAIVGGATMLVLGLDVIFGSRLQLSSLMGLQPVIGGRFYGMGNVTFALFGTATLLLATALADRSMRRRRRGEAAAWVAGVGLVGLVVDGLPAWGADGGGPPALLPALAYLTLTVLGVRLTWRRWLLIGLATVALFLAVAVGDWLRPVASRSHLGNFFQAILDGTALEIVQRKLEQNVGILLGNWPLTMLVPISLAFVIYVLLRPTTWGSRSLTRAYDRSPALKPGLFALLVMLVIGFAVNDSGVAIPAVGATLAVPLIIAVAVRAVEDDARADELARRGRRPGGARSAPTTTS